MQRLKGRYAIARALVVWLTCCIWAAGAQPRQEKENLPEPFYKRFSVGVRGTVLPNSLTSNRTITESTTDTDPPLSTTEFSEPASKHFTVGPTVQFDITDRFGVNADFLYRRGGYDAGTFVVTQPTDDDDDSEFLGGDFERTRAHCWDVSILGRYYNRSRDAGGVRPYITGGLALRTVSGIETFWETIDENALSDTDTVPVEAANKSVRGAVLGGGLQLRDESGLKIELEVRYTHWLQRTFDLYPTRSSLNQTEFTLGFTF